jgi:hypothetical protein
MKNIKTFEGFLDFFSNKNKEVLDKLIAGESVTINQEDIDDFKFKAQLRSDGTAVAVSELPELKGLKFNYQEGGKFYVVQKMK